MKLTQFGLLKAIQVLFVGELVKTNVTTSEGESWYVGKLLTPIIVRCSTDKEIEPIEADELYVREHDANGDAWEFVDEADPEKGYFIKDYKTDFSKGQEFCIYQETTIAEWARGSRKEKSVAKKLSINEKILQRRAQRALEMAGNPEPVAPLTAKQIAAAAKLAAKNGK